MGTYRVEWGCCGSVTETDAWEPSECPICAPSEAAMRKDAERYRFIRDSTPEQFDQFEPGLYSGGDELDELTDAAMNGANSGIKPTSEASSA